MSISTAPLFLSRVSRPLWWAAAVLLCLAMEVSALGYVDVFANAKLLTGAIVLFGFVIALAPQASADDRVKLWPYALTLIVFWGLMIWEFRSAIINGERYFFLQDDMMISMRYARNLVDGLGWVWNPGERLEGFTNPLWTLIMSAVHWLPLPDRLTSLPVMIFSTAAVLISMPLSQRWARELGANASTQHLVLLAMIVNAGVIACGILAFEQGIIATVLLFAVLALLDDIKTGAVRPWGYLCLGIIPLIRMDAAVLSAATGLWVIYEHPKRFKVIAALALAVIPSIAAMLARHAYYGDWLPNTYYLKTTGWSGRWKTGVRYAIDFLRDYGWVYLLIVVTVLRDRSLLTPALRATVLISGAQLAYGAYVGGDILGIFRIYATVIPLLIAAGLTSVQILFKQKYLVAVISVVVIVLWARPLGVLGGLMDGQRRDIGNIGLGLALNQHAPQASVADGYAGSAFYFAPQTRGIDVLGKMDAHIARMPAAHGGTVPGHNKFDYDYSIGQLHPEYVIAVFEGAAPTEDQLKHTQGNWVYPYYLWNNVAFRQHCLPNPMPWKTWRLVYRCDWSTSANPT